MFGDEQAACHYRNEEGDVAAQSQGVRLVQGAGFTRHIMSEHGTAQPSWFIVGRRGARRR